MSDYVKWIGAGLGWALGGPIGAIFGLLLGSAVDNANKNEAPKYKRNDQEKKQNTKPGDFEISFLILSAIVIKADGKIDKRELDFVRNYFIQMYGSAKAERSFKLFNGIIKKNVPTIDVCRQIRENMDYASRLQLMQYLFGISKADGDIHYKEIEEIKKISGYLQIGMADFESIKAMFIDAVFNAYKVLEIKETATVTEIKIAYRNMVKKYHPDKVRHLGEEHQKAAEEKFKQVQKAYELIQKERGL
ncbi:MAG TPA: molecular chaperone DjiA [Flavobacteriia bacterium]|nr:molecular chaperone DjiA [Flavobacteriia bacterium]